MSCPRRGNGPTPQEVGGISHFEYTHFDLLAARTHPDGARYEFEHDSDLRLAQVTAFQGLTWDCCMIG
ncbi:hypothetical protein [Streptomyces sp. TE5632]